jgi:AcrR family transcriptional regulator
MASGPAERTRLLGLVRDYILEHGVVGLTLSHLARSIGSNNRMLLYHFGSLDQLLEDAIGEVLDRDSLISRLSQLMQSAATSVERITAAWQHISDPERLPHLQLFFARFGMAADAPHRYPDFLERTRLEWIATVAAGLRDDRAIMDPEVTAAAVVALWRGLQILLISGEERASIDQVHDEAVSLILSRPSRM